MVQFLKCFSTFPSSTDEMSARVRIDVLLVQAVCFLQMYFWSGVDQRVHFYAANSTFKYVPVRVPTFDFYLRKIPATISLIRKFCSSLISYPHYI